MMDDVEVEIVQDLTKEEEHTVPAIIEEKHKKEGWKLWVKDIIIWILIFATIKFMFSVVLINAVIPSESMKPTINKGDLIIGYRLAYSGDRKPQREDVIIFNSDGKYLIKRVIALPGETVEFIDGIVYVNGKNLVEDYLSHNTPTESGSITEPIVVPEGCYFVLGDNRGNSKDSRYMAEMFVAEEDIVAKALFRYFPVKYISNIR